MEDIDYDTFKKYLKRNTYIRSDYQFSDITKGKNYKIVNWYDNELLLIISDYGGGVEIHYTHFHINEYIRIQIRIQNIKSILYE